MKGRVIAVDRLPDGREIAALQVDGVLEDLLVDAPAEAASPQPGATYHAIVDRPLKGMGGVTVQLGGGRRGFLREHKGLAPGQKLLVQTTTNAEPGKAVPVTTRILFKSRYTIVTPDRPGNNISRQIKDEEERARLADLCAEGMEGASGLGLILRSAAEGRDEETILADISDMRKLATEIMADTGADAPTLLLDAPGAAELAWRDWASPEPDEVRERAGSFEELSLWEAVEAAKGSVEKLSGGAWFSVEPTSALVAIDVNTGGDTSLAAGLKANIATIRALPRALRVRGLGGQITVDFAPYPKKERKVLEQVIRSSLKGDSVETSFAGWTPLGHAEFQRKRERRPLRELLP
ncbi:ribonuclease E/G [Algicella marina]|uniref:Ribonuclease G n=1 Tax=Algicella marina TaxID=2683284 RepID=A0A6P1T1K8_9RHOB|nr:ribonuclease E/G [Algicella marina]QHQ35346.1 ribonuclease G [Algicella marina]